MTKTKKVQKVVALVLSLVMIFSCSVTSFAAENEVEQDEREYLVVNGTDVVPVGEDYENPDTGEYVHWNVNARGTDKKFSFKIRYSLTSSSFKVNSTKEKVAASASVQDNKGNKLSGYKGHKYTVSLVGVYSRNLQFAVSGKQSGTVTGLKKGGSYKVKITNNDHLSDTKYLVGSGTVRTM